MVEGSSFHLAMVFDKILKRRENIVDYKNHIYKMLSLLFNLFFLFNFSFTVFLFNCYITLISAILKVRVRG